MIFVDTGAWIAILDKSDRYHKESVRIYTELKQGREQFLTTDYVLDETATRLRYDAGYQLAVKFFDGIYQAREVGALRIVRIDEVLFDKGVSIFRQYDSAILSFTDCTSFAVCRMYNIHQTFAFDKHFAMMGISLCL